jgi:uncharacterized FlgJ-related protein
MTKFRDYSVEDTIESVVRALARAEPYNSIREGHDATREDESTDLSTRRP